MSKRIVTVFSVMFHSDSRPYAGACGDGSFIQRFRDELTAKDFAIGRHYYGKPAKVTREDDVPLKLAQRWGVA